MPFLREQRLVSSVISSLPGNSSIVTAQRLGKHFIVVDSLSSITICF